MDKNRQFFGVWAVILGGSSGFGFAALQKLAAHGMNIAVVYRETAIAERTLKEKLNTISANNQVSILPYNINALEQSGRDLFLEQIKKVIVDEHCVKVLLHSIARGNLKRLVDDSGESGNSELSVDDIQYTAYAMCNSLLDWTRMLLKEGLFNHDARVIGLTSGGAHKYWEGYAAVSIAKASLESLSRYMAVEFCSSGLKTNLIQAGVTETASLKKIPGSDKLIEMAGKHNPMGRITRPADVANVIYMLCTDEAFWINGSLIHVDGGEHCL